MIGLDLMYHVLRGYTAYHAAMSESLRYQQEVYRSYEEQMAGNRQYTEAEKRERAILSVMKDWPLGPDEILFVGPASAEILATPGAFKGSLPDTWTEKKPAQKQGRKRT